MPSTPTDRHTRRRRVLKDAPRLSGDMLSPAQVDLLMSKIQEDASTGCWTWQGATNAQGYGLVVWLTRCYKPHRLLYEWFTGEPVKPGDEVDHLCGCRNCVNPAHLEACSKSENLRRRFARDARPLFDWRSARDAALNLSHLDSITQE